MHYTLRDPAAFAALLDEQRWTTRLLATVVTAGGYSVSHQRIGQLRTGTHPNVDPKLARRIERTLRVEPGELFDRNESGA
jgi:hypothetical protein